MECEGITGPSVDRCTVKGEFKIGRGLKTDQLSVNKRLRIEELAVLPYDSGRVQYKLMPRQLPEEEFGPHRPQPVEKVGQRQRCDAVDAKHVYWRRIVAEV